jgi:thiamine pyrophosphate-dependent acetolactate synthase large subunit-like protein
VAPSPPNFKFIAEAYSIPYFHLTKISSLRKILDKATKKMREKEFKPCIIEVDEHNFSLGSQNNG